LAGFLTHLAIAKLYAEKNGIRDEDKKRFYHGNLYPDFQSADPNNTDKTGHYYKERFVLEERTKRRSFEVGRIDFPRFFATNKVETPFEKGVLLHLITDNTCHREILDEKRFYDLVAQGVRPRWIVTGSYNSANEHLKKKYKVDFEMTGIKDEIEACLATFAKNNGEMPFINLIDTPEAVARLDAFIEKTAGVNLEEFTRAYL